VTSILGFQAWLVSRILETGSLYSHFCEHSMTRDPTVISFVSSHQKRLDEHLWSLKIILNNDCDWMEWIHSYKMRIHRWRRCLVSSWLFACYFKKHQSDSYWSDCDFLQCSSDTWRRVKLCFLSCLQDMSELNQQFRTQYGLILYREINFDAALINWFLEIDWWRHR